MAVCFTNPLACSSFSLFWSYCFEFPDQEGQGKTLNNLGAAAYMQGQYAPAVAHHEESLQIAQRIGDRIGEAAALTGLGLALLGAGELARAEAALAAAVALRRHRNNTNLLMESLTSLAALEEVLAYLADGGSFAGTEYSFLNYWHCDQILAANEDERRDALLQTAVAQLQTHLAHIQSQEVQHSFRHNIPWHQALLDQCITKTSNS